MGNGYQSLPTGLFFSGFPCMICCSLAGESFGLLDLFQFLERQGKRGIKRGCRAFSLSGRRLSGCRWRAAVWAVRVWTPGFPCPSCRQRRPAWVCLPVTGTLLVFLFIRFLLVGLFLVRFPLLVFFLLVLVRLIPVSADCPFADCPALLVVLVFLILLSVGPGFFIGPASAVHFFQKTLPGPCAVWASLRPWRRSVRPGPRRPGHRG